MHCLGCLMPQFPQSPKQLQVSQGRQFLIVYYNLFHVISKAVVSHGGSLGALELLAWRRNLAKILIVAEPQFFFCKMKTNYTHTIGPHRKVNKIRDIKALKIVKGSLIVGNYYHTFFQTMFFFKFIFLLRKWFWHTEMAAKGIHSFKKYLLPSTVYCSLLYLKSQPQ